MFGMLENLTKAAVAVALTPVALAVDIVTLPSSACDIHKGPFDKTGDLLKAAGENIYKAVESK